MVNHRMIRLVKLVRTAGILRPRDLHAHGIPRLYLRMAVDRGAIVRVGRGLYVARGAKPTEHHSLAQASKRMTKGVVCLPRLPKQENPQLRIVRFSTKALTYGVQGHRIEGVPVRVFTPAKTVADCFRYRNKIGLDVALEALRDCKRKRKATMDEIWKAAKVCRMANVMRPYLESIS